MNRMFNSQTVFALVMAIVLVAGVGFANQTAERKVTQVASHNVSATSLLARIQIQAEKMRRYEKEMFIYAATPDKRAKYVKEFNDATVKLMDLQNDAAAAGHKGFTDADRAEVLKWKEATAFYSTEFTKVVGKAETSAPDANLTVSLNTDIGPGKDRFREVLDGASKMREAKEKLSTQIGGDIRRGFQWVMWAVMGMAALLVLAAAFFFTPTVRRESRTDPRTSSLRGVMPTELRA
jgi:hypothetical protein